MSSRHPVIPPNQFRTQSTWAQSLSIVCLGAGLALSVAGCFKLFAGDASARLTFKFAYLAAFAFVLSFGLGALFFVMIQHVTGAKWSIVVRRISEQLMMTLPLSAVMFILILFWMRDIFPWTDPAHLDEILKLKTPYLNIPFFVLRACVYFAVWIGLAWLLRSKSLKQDRTGDPRLKLSMSRWSAPGLVLFALTITFASFDWLMSLSPHWYSTIYGVYYFSGAVLASLSLIIIFSALVAQSGDVGDAITTEHFHDLGKLLFGFVVFWAYIAFSQLLLIWMANIPEETRWFYDRWENPGWRAMSLFLVFGHFVLPFLFLLPRTIKRFRPTLVLAAIWIIAIHYVDLHYLVLPAVSPDRVIFSITETLLAVGMLLLLSSLFFHLLHREAMVPVRDPHLTQSMAFENF